QEKLGLLIEARENYMSIKREQLPSSAPQAFVDAKNEAISELAALEERIPYATIQVTGAEAARVTVNGEELSSVFVGVSRPMNPGKYVIQASGEGLQSEPFELNLMEGAKQVVPLQLVPVATGSTAAPIETATPDAVAHPSAAATT